VTALLVGPFPKPTRENCFHQSAASIGDIDYASALADAARRRAGAGSAAVSDISGGTLSQTESTASMSTVPPTTDDGRSVMRVGVLTVSDRVSAL
jgi:hypothetical protein